VNEAPDVQPLEALAGQMMGVFRHGASPAAGRAAMKV
jgi:hypothetical protein